MRTSTSALGFGLLLFTAFSTPAYAQSTAAGAPATATATAGAPPYPSCTGRAISPEESNAAHDAYLAGRSAYDNSNWDAAIAQYREAYRRDCTKPELLINISRAYESKGDLQEALNALQAYFDRVPASNADASLRARMENIQKRIAAESKAKEPVVEQQRPAPERSHTILPWVVVGVGGAAVITGAVILVTKPSMPSNCESGSGTCVKGVGESDADLQADRDRAGKSRTQGTTGIVLMGAGAAVAVGGLIWHFLEPTGSIESRSAKKPTVTPTVGPGFAGLSLGGAF
ncbi:MAG: tetratricopeptide repeat protein [Polyangiaceae bacterium]|nr:tetratricopeptide repeat protein [Polyangiaceae bacterium]